MKTLILSTIIFLLSACTSGPIQLDGMQAYNEFQNDADIIRLRHLKYYGDLIEEYYDVTGDYPFMAEADIPLNVFIANDQQYQATRQKPPYPTKEKSFKEFIALVEEKLGRNVEEYYDPQYAGDYKPNFYIYMANRGAYYFAIHQHNSYPFSRQIAKHYNKIEISNKPTTQNGAVPARKLLSHGELEYYSSQPVKKGRFFQRTRAETHS